MSEYDDIIANMPNAASAATISALDDNPDEAAQAVDLSKSTGTPPAVIYGDFANYRQQHKMMLASSLVRNNLQLSQYVSTHPLAAAISNDDYGNLDQFSRGAGFTSRALEFLNAPSAASREAILGGLKGFKEGFTAEPYGTMASQSPFLSAHPMLGALVATGQFPVETVLKAMSGVAGAATGAAKAGATTAFAGLTGNKAGAESFGRDIAALTEYQMIKGEGHAPVATEVAGQIARAREAYSAAKPWLDAGVEPPRGLHPLIDESKAQLNSEALGRLNTDLGIAQESLTRERSPDMFQSFVQQHFGQSEIGISGDSVAALYKDRMPTPDDGLLGWVPGIEDKLALARETGADVHVPISDWMTKVDPQLAASLNDDVRMWPGGVTAREATAPIEPKPMVDAPLAQVRGSADLEPMFSIGDRKLTMERMDTVGNKAREIATIEGKNWEALTPEEQAGLLDHAKKNMFFGPEQGFHDFKLVDQTGKEVAALNISAQDGGKTLYVENIEGLGPYGPRDFGPSLMRDLLRQLKEEFPEAETLTGHRVSGARDKAESFNQPSAHPQIKLEAPEGWDVVDTANEFQKILEGGRWEGLTSSVDAYIRPRTDLGPTQRAIVDAVRREAARVVPTARVQEATKLEARNVRGVKGTVEPTGLYMQYRDAMPLIAYSLEGPNPIATFRHEAIHHLRQYGFFTPKEWGILEKASKDFGWRETFNINERYPTAKESLQLEESIADAYKTWEHGGPAPSPEVRGIFEKMKDLFTRIKAAIGKILGREPTWEDIFKKVDIGEIGQREGTTPLSEGAFRPRAEIPDEAKASLQTQLDHLKAESAGLDLKSYQKIQKLIQERYAEDLAAAQSRAEKEQAKRQTTEWKDNARQIQKEVEENIRQRPDVAADLFFGSGELFGKKLDKKYRLRADDLTPEQTAALPKHYIAKDGLPVDDAAMMFGFKSGDAMVQKLGEYNAAKEGRTPQEMLAQVIKDETNRQMEAKFGLLDKNIMEDARDQALSETNLNLLAEEMYAAGHQAGMPVIDKNVAKEWVRDQFARMTIQDASSDRFMSDIGRHGRDAERSLIAGDPSTALVSMQKKYVSALLAAESRKLQKEVAAFDKTAKRFSKREIPTVDPEYTNYVHQILMQVGKPVRRSVQDLAEQIGQSPSKGLEDFVQQKSGQLREMPVWEQLYDLGWRKEYTALTTEEFRAINDSVKALIHNGRDELKIERAGEAADFNDIKSQMISQLKEFKERQYDVSGNLVGAMPKPFRTFVATHLKLETIINRWDKFDPHGTWNQYVMRDLVDGANQESAWRKEYAAKFRELKDGVDLSRTIDNPLFREPNGGPLFTMTRANLRAVMLNTGNSSNLAKLAKGYGLDPADVMAWVHQHATKEDWDFTQKVWNGIFKDLKSRSDTMYRSLTGGVAPESIVTRPIDTPFGTYEGGYYPIIFHPTFEGTSRKLMGKDPLEQDNYVRATTPAGYTKSRTGYAAPLALDLDMLPGRVSQMLHDVALRPAVLNASKVFYDKDIRSAIMKHYGPEYRDMLIPYLRDVANSSNYMTAAQKEFQRWSEFIRQNMISTLIGFNPGTVLKHGPTAWWQSMQEVGHREFLNEVKGLWSINEATGETNWQFAMKHSQELQRRDMNWQETLSGAVQELVPTGKYDSLRQNVIKLASKPVALSDMISAVPTWLAQYKKSMAENGGIIGDAVFDADRAVRRAHGSTAITDRPAVMRDLNPWLTSVYNFFNHIMNRQAEMVWKAGDTMKLVKDGEFASAMKDVPHLSAQLFAYVIFPAIVEELVSPLPLNHDRSWATKAAAGVGYTLSSSWIGVRDVANGIIRGSDPSVGLISSAYKQISNAARDVMKDKPLSKDHAGKLISDATGLVGTLSGVVPQQAGRVARFGFDVSTGKENPRGPWGWLVGLRFGTLEHHSKTFDDWMKGRE